MPEWRSVLYERPSALHNVGGKKSVNHVNFLSWIVRPSVKCKTYV